MVPVRGVLTAAGVLELESKACESTVRASSQEVPFTTDLGLSLLLALCVLQRILFADCG